MHARSICTHILTHSHTVVCTERGKAADPASLADKIFNEDDSADSGVFVPIPFSLSLSVLLFVHVCLYMQMHAYARLPLWLSCAFVVYASVS
jgi:hypothetical protein